MGTFGGSPKRGLFFGSLILDPGCPKHDAGVILVLVVLVLCLSFPANRQAGAGGDYRVFVLSVFLSVHRKREKIVRSRKPNLDVGLLLV